ncbi:MAG TPA: hypothetical protein PLB18_07235, partial [Acidobacteriota bacterium]|nr:hypothetical protein [Acidobacteriota bacterium]
MRLSFQQFTRTTCGVVCLNLMVLTTLPPVWAQPSSITPIRLKSILPQDQPQDIIVGKIIEYEVSNQKPQVHLFSLKMGEYLEFEIQSTNQHLKISRLKPGTGWDESVRAPNGSQTVLESWVLAEATGLHQFKVETTDPTVKYTLKIVEYRPATEADWHLLKATQVIAEGTELKVLQTKEAILQAIEKYKLAVKECQLAGNLSCEAELVNSIGNLYYNFGELAQA